MEFKKGDAQWVYIVFRCNIGYVFMVSSQNATSDCYLFIWWTNWMKWCIFTLKFYLLVNNTHRFSQCSKSLGQVDPFCPFTFALMMEFKLSFGERGWGLGFCWTLGQGEGEGWVSSGGVCSDIFLLFVMLVNVIQNN